MPTFAEFFAGIGLMRLGLERQGWKAVFANDIDPQKYEMYRSQYDDAEQFFLLADINTLTGEQIPPIEMATASFPCNDLSLAGGRKGIHGHHSGTFWSFIRILREMEDRRPPIVLIENVVGFLNSNEGNDFEAALLALNELGYSVDSFIIDAASFVPQSRQRLFIVGALAPSINQTGVYASSIRPKELTKFILKHPNVRWNFRSLPSLPRNDLTIHNIIEELPDTAPEWWCAERAEYLLHQMSTRHRLIAEFLIQNNVWSYGTVFRRMRNGRSTAELRVDGIAGCLRTPRGGSAKQILFKAGYGRYFARLLTPRECARLMGVDDYTITVPRDQALFGFGDAVCVPVIEWIAENYLNPAFNELTQEQPILIA